MDESGDIGAERDNPQMVGACEIKCKSCELRPQAMVLQRPRHFGVIEDDPIREASVGQHPTKAINEQFEALGLFVVGDANLVEVYIHGSPCGLAGILALFHEGLRAAGKVYQGIPQN